MKNALIVASVASMIDQFNMRNISILQANGYKVVVACNFEKGSSCSNERVAELKKKLKALDVDYYNIDFTKKVYNIYAHYIALKQLKDVLKKYDFSLLHCTSPIGALIARKAAKKYRKKGLRVIYSAHGFHFYKGAPLLNWLLFYPLEKKYAKYTDVLITTNTEDYELAKKKFNSKKIMYVPGVGIDVNKFRNTSIVVEDKRKSLCVPQDAFLLVSVGELNRNKNHQVVIEALSVLNNKNIHYVIVGQGPERQRLIDLINKLNLQNNVHLLGFRTDVAEIYKAADVVVFPSIREGFGLAAIEGMACGLPLICSNNRGSKTYAKNNINALVCDYNDVYNFASAIDKLYNNREFRISIAKNSVNSIKDYDCSKIDSMIKKIYIE